MKYIENKLNADRVSLKDVNNNYASENVEGALEEIDSKIKEKATKQEVDVERKRINTFTALADGSTTGDAELIDGRIGQDGINYDNVGSAIRTQFTKVYDNIENTNNGKELLPIDFEIGSYDPNGNKVENYYRACSTGIVIADKSYKIQCEPGYHIYIHTSDNNTGWVTEATITEGMEFVITIKKEVEERITDPYVLVSKVKRSSVIFNEINKNNSMLLDKININKDSIDMLESGIIKKKILFSVGGLAASTGTSNGAKDRIVCDYIDISKVKYITFKQAVNGCVFRYDANHNYIDNTIGSFSLLPQTIKTENYSSDSCRYIKILSSDISLLDTINANTMMLLTIEKYSSFVGKKCSIYGDSISTYEGWIPEGNRVYYNGNNCDVSSVEQTWWRQVINELGMELVVNNSWSGRCVTTFRDNESGNLNSAGCREENVIQLKTDSKTPDIIFIKLGVNDFLRFGTSLPMGEYKGLGDIPSDMTSFREAYAIMLNNVRKNFPNADVYCCTVMHCKRSELGYPNRNNGYTINDVNNAIIDMASLFGCKVLRHDLCGINYYNADVTLGDGVLHPNSIGHKMIADYTIYELTKK